MKKRDKKQVDLFNDKQNKLINVALVVLCLFLVLYYRLFSFMFSILLVHSVIKHFTPCVEKYCSDKKARFYSTIFISIATVAIVSFIFIYLSISFMWAIDDIVGLKRYFIEIINKSYDVLESWIPWTLTFSKKDILQIVLEWTKENTSLIKVIGENTINVLINIFIGLVVGILIALEPINTKDGTTKFKKEFDVRLNSLVLAFSNVVFAQVKISLVNTVLTGIYLMLILPLLDIHIPYTKTLIILTFVFGLLPIIGNIISNTFICIASFSVAVSVLFMSLVFLVVIHKAEYFLNAKIIGNSINARAWEILIAMVVCKTLFGLSGLIAAPIYYAYLKYELKQLGLL